MTVINLKLAAQCLTEMIKADIAVFLHGPPGVGKSEVVDQVGAMMKYPVIDIRTNIREPVDLRGLPCIDIKAGTTRWLAPAELPNEERDGPCGILKLDELNTASKAMEAAALSLVLERKCGEYALPKGWVPVATGNRVLDRASAQRLGTAMRNRFAHFEVVPDVEAWAQWANAVQLDPTVIGFIRFRPDLLHKMPAGDENAFPTPRSWAQVARIAHQPTTIRQHLVAALVGDGPGAEFEGFARLCEELPSIDDILANPKKAAVPSHAEPGIFYAVSSALSRRSTKQTFKNALIYAERLPKEFEVLIAVDAVHRDPLLTRTQAFSDWIVRNKEVML